MNQQNFHKITTFHDNH